MLPRALQSDRQPDQIILKGNGHDNFIGRAIFLLQPQLTGRRQRDFSLRQIEDDIKMFQYV